MTISRTTTKTKKARAKKKAPTKTTASTPAPLATTATAALSALAEIVASVPTDEATTASIMAARGTNRVPDQAMTIVQELVTENPDSFPNFDPTVIENGLAYEQAMGPVVTKLDGLSRSISETIQLRRGAGATVTLAVYQVLKGLAKGTPSQSFPVQQRDLETLLTTTHKSRATSVSKTEAQAAVKATKVAKVKSAKVAKVVAAANAIGLELASSPQTTVAPPTTAASVAAAPTAPAAPPAAPTP